MTTPKPVDQFASLVRQYASCIDGADDLTPHALLSRCARLLPLIYNAGLDLPQVDSVDPDDTSPIDGAPTIPMSRLATKLGRCDFYYEVFDPVFDTEAIGASLVDDLAEIYLDLVRPLMAFDLGHELDAHWSSWFAIRGHCGDHLVDALRVIHRLVNGHLPTDYNPE
ncbi:MAG: DUF5063 domain-containing protein [Polyangiaceae bacterium]